MSLDDFRRELERRKGTEAAVYVCPEHGERTTLVCVPCYARQQERVERESAPLRYANTAPNLRARVLEQLASMNGHGH